MKSKVAIIVVDTFSSYATEYLGPSRIVAYLKQHNIDADLIYIKEDGKSDINDMVNKIPANANLIGFTIYDANLDLVNDISSELKKRNKNIITFVGSRFATLAGKLIFNDCPNIDYIILGDGEIVTYQMIIQYEENDLNFEKSPHIIARESTEKKIPAIVNIETMPRISREYLKSNKNSNFMSARITGSKGCTCNCSFCTLLDAKKTKCHRAWHGRSIDDIFDEIRDINKNYGVKSFSFTDNSFEDPDIIGKQRIKDFCELCKDYEQKLHFWCYLRADSFHESDVELIKLMESVGFTQVFIGFEAGNKEDLLLYNKRATVEDNKRTFKLFTENGIDIQSGFIMFNPYSTINRIQQNYEFLCSNNTIMFKQYYGHLMAYYGSEIYTKLLNDNLLDADYSYLNTLKYKFIDDDVKKVSDFIVNNIFDEHLEFFDDEYTTFQSTIAFIKALVPEIYEKYSNQINSYNLEIANIISDFFEIIYIKQDLFLAKSKINDFKEKLYNFYQKFNIFKFSILKERKVIQLIRESKMKRE